ncbi:phosphate uptake regulator PhoU [Paucilactobacillus vaccinostercus DSM 20634]|uniref:Phosphate-specific transport system accessory protein PhoU n=2 Tax=Paucilactobacillus vaccinostercus TaxID=176291 RepID=A0A0R2A002_9LACO|nr:phosphate uptake regulator PhoU [Paucilactobacillus vaccinostercus DSM 20634]
MEMGINISEQIYQATSAFTQYDKKLAQQVIDDDQRTNSEEIFLEKEALKLIALQQPVASDFREIISILKASSDLERIGDHAVNIARETLNTSDQKNDVKIEKQIGKMAGDIRKMLEQVMDAYVNRDERQARKGAEKDLKIDQQYIDIRKAVTNAIESQETTAERGSSYLMIDRLLERIGDHIVNLCEWVVYNQSGKIVELNAGKISPELLQN